MGPRRSRRAGGPCPTWIVPIASVPRSGASSVLTWRAEPPALSLVGIMDPPPVYVVHHKWMLHRAEPRELGEGRYRHRGDALAAAHEAHSLAGRELHVHGAGLDADRGGEALSHVVAEGCEPRLLARHGGINVRRGHSGLVQHRAHRSQQLERVGVAPALVRV